MDGPLDRQISWQAKVNGVRSDYILLYLDLMTCARYHQAQRHEYEMAMAIPAYNNNRWS
jgi:hypothetical protein